MTVDVKRKYDSPRRRAQAPATTLRVPTATRQLTLDRRYPATTMADVAAAAGVAVHAVCSATGGGKATLAQRVWDVTLAGDLDPVPLGTFYVVEPIWGRRTSRPVGHLQPHVRPVIHPDDHACFHAVAMLLLLLRHGDLLLGHLHDALGEPILDAFVRAKIPRRWKRPGPVGLLLDDLQRAEMSRR